MSWPQWSGGSQPSVPPVLNPATPVINSAPAVVPPGLQYTQDQWAQLQQQNWNQWAQWQQQYQQWHQQYGAEYQKSINALAQAAQAQQPVPGLPNVAIPPPLPTEVKPPLPTEDPPPPVPSYTTAPPPNQPGYNTAPPPAPKTSERPPVHYAKNQNQNWQTQNYRYGPEGQQNKRSFDQGSEQEAKRQMINKPGWQTQPPPLMQQQVRPPKENIEELSEAEKKFDKQFADWEAQFNKWKEQNVEHPDKEQYREYEKKWESWRAQLLERREQMKRKRLGLAADSPSRSRPGSGQSFNQPNQSYNSPQQNFSQPPPQQNFNQPPPKIVQNVPPKAAGGLLPTPPPSGAGFNKPPPNLNDEPLKFKDSKVPELDENVGDFIKPNTGGGIPGLDLVKDDPKPAKPEGDDVVVIDPEEKEKKGPDFDAISKGINTILGDQKLLNMLSMVSKTQDPKANDNLTNTVSRIKDPNIPDPTAQVPSHEQSNQSYEEHSNQSDSYAPREFVNNFDDQTRSSFTMAHNEQEMKFDGPGNFNRNQKFDQNQFPNRFDNFNKGTRFGGPDNEQFNKNNFGRNDFNRPDNSDRFGPKGDRFPPIGGPNQDKFGPPIGGPNQDKFGPPIGGPNQDKFGPNQGDRFPPVPGPNQDRFGSNQDRFGPNQRDRFPPFGGNSQEKFDPNHGDKFPPSEGPNQDKFPANQGGRFPPVGGPSQERFAGNQGDRFPPPVGAPNQGDRFPPPIGAPNQGDRFPPPVGAPNQERFGTNQRDRFPPVGGPNQDRFGPNQGDRFPPVGGPNQDRFGPNQGDRFPSIGGPNKDRFGPNQGDRFPSGQNQERFGPNQGDRFKPVGGQNQDRFASDSDKFGPNQDRFGPKQDNFRPNQNRFDQNVDRFGPNKDRFGTNQDRFGPNQDRFGSNQDRFGQKPDRFGHNQERFGSNQDKFGSNYDRFGGNQDRFSSQRNDFKQNNSRDRFPPRDQDFNQDDDQDFPPDEDFEEQFDYGGGEFDDFDQDPQQEENYDDNYDYDEVAASFENDVPDVPVEENMEEPWKQERNYQEKKFNEPPVNVEPPSTPAAPQQPEIFQPTTVIDYEHKSKAAEPEVLIEPIFMFDYRHKPLSRIPLPQRPKWLSETVKNIREFDPPVVRPYEPPNLRRYPPPGENWRNDRYQENWAPHNRRNYNENRPSFTERRPYGENRSYEEPQDDWNPPSDNRRREEKKPFSENRSSYQEEKKQLPFQSMDFDEEKISDTEWPEDDETEEIQKPNVIFPPKFQKEPDNKTNPNKANSNKTAALIEDLISPPGRYKRPPRIVIILRGPPGSGKTFLAKLIKDKEVENGGSTPRILSLDDYFMVEQEKEVTEEGKKVKIKEMVYEYEAEMEESYRTSLVKSFKKTITDGYFSFIIVDNVNDKVKYFGEMWSFAKQNGFQVYICQLDLDVQTCSKRNIHGRSETDIEKCVAAWEPTPAHHPVLDATSLLQSASIPEVEMEEVNSPESDNNELDGSEDQVARSKWDNFDCSVHNLAKLDGVSKPLRHRTMEEYLRLDTDWTPIKPTKPGQKRVRWADLEEQKQQEKMRAIGFVVGHTNWNRMMDPTGGSSALTQTKYIERTGRFKVDQK